MSPLAKSSKARQQSEALSFTALRKSDMDDSIRQSMRPETSSFSSQITA